MATYRDRLRPWLLEILRCPSCQEGVTWNESGASCAACRLEFTWKAPLLDLLPTRLTSAVHEGEGAGWPEYAREAGLFDLGERILSRYPHDGAHEKLESYLRSPDRPARLAELEGRKPTILHDVPQRGLLRALALAEEMGAKRILDLGCSWGWALRDFTLLGYEAVGCDVSTGMLEKGASLHETWKLAPPLLRASAEHIPFADRSFDLVFCSSLLHHIEDLHAMARQVHRVLRPGGIFTAIFERFEPDGSDIDDFVQTSAAGHFGIREGFVTAPSLQSAFVAAGFEPRIRVSWGENYRSEPPPTMMGRWRQAAHLGRRSGFLDLEATSLTRSLAGRHLSALPFKAIESAGRVARRLRPLPLPGLAHGEGPGLVEGWFEVEGDFRWTAVTARARLAARPGPATLLINCTSCLDQALELRLDGETLESQPLKAGHNRLEIPVQIRQTPCTLDISVDPGVPPELRPYDHRPLGMAVRRLALRPR